MKIFPDLTLIGADLQQLGAFRKFRSNLGEGGILQNRISVFGFALALVFSASVHAQTVDKAMLAARVQHSVDVVIPLAMGWVQFAAGPKLYMFNTSNGYLSNVGETPDGAPIQKMAYVDNDTFAPWTCIAAGAQIYTYRFGSDGIKQATVIPDGAAVEKLIFTGNKLGAVYVVAGAHKYWFDPVTTQLY